MCCENLRFFPLSIGKPIIVTNMKSNGGLTPVVAGGYIGDDTFAKKWIHVTGMCRHEALQAFDTIADLGDGFSIDAATFNAAFDVLCNWTFCSACRLNRQFQLHVFSLSLS